MISHKDLHLAEEQILHAVLDEAELSPAQKKHLIKCSQCRGKKERCEHDLERLGDLAKHFTPLPKNRISLPAENTGTFSIWPLSWRASLGAAMAAALVIFFVWYTGPLRTGFQDNTDMQTGEVFEPDPLMTEIRMLTENALPIVYQEISGEYDADLDKEFMQFIVPSIDTEPLSFEEEAKRARLC